MKKLDDKAFDIITEHRKEGLSYKDIIPYLHDAGYRTTTERKFIPVNISQFMIKRGVRKRVMKKSKPHHAVLPDNLQPKQTKGGLFKTILRSKELTASQKIKVLEVLA